ncbi:MAG: class I SAM-dependent methyltransferase [Alphaproteobacteria bacterium]|nr:class I SAM-dependent methyltransferase [Alphaproteobacteria bacterium]
MTSRKLEQDTWDAYNKFHFLCDTSRFQKLFVRLELFRLIQDLPGDIVDAGSFKGISAIQFAHMLKAYRPHSLSKVLTCDTFVSEFPLLREHERHGNTQLSQAFDPKAHETLLAAIERLQLKDRIDILKGDIVETLRSHVQENPGFRVSLLHCDLDAYEPTLHTLRTIWPRIVPGGVVIFDEYAIGMWGESDAVDEFFATLPKQPRMRTLQIGPTPTAYCIKE